MRRLNSLFSLAALAALLLLAGAARARAESSIEQVQAAMSELNAWLGEGDKADRWRKVLRCADLLAQLEQGDDADQQTVRSILERYESGAAGLDHERFVAVKSAMRLWLADLSLPRADELGVVIEDAKIEFLPITEARVEASKSRLQSAMSRLQQFLSSDAERKELGWRKFLRWTDLEAELTREDTPSLRVLQDIEKLYRSNFGGLELAEFTDVRDALHEYIFSVYFANRPTVEDEYFEKLTELEQALEAYQTEPTGEDASKIGRTLGWLDSAGQGHLVVRGVRRHYLRPNLFAQVSGNLILAGSSQNIDDTTAVRDNIMGADISGWATTVGKTSMQLVPNPRGASFEIQLVGTTTSSTVGTQGPVSVHTSGYTQLSARKMVTVDAAGLSDQPAEAQAATSTSTGRVDAPPVVRCLARRLIDRNRGQTERQASYRAQQQVASRVDSQAEEALAKANDAFLNKFKNPLVRRGEFPQMLEFATTESHLNVKLLQANAFQLGAPTQPPAHRGEHDLAVRVHETVVSNFAEALLARETLTGERLMELLKEVTGKEPEGLPADEDRTPWSITFATSRPIAIEFNDQKVKVIIRGREFSRGDQIIDDPMEIAATYSVQRFGGGSKWVRDGELYVDYIRKGPQSPRQITFKTFLKKKLDPLFKQETTSDGLKLPGQFEAVGKLHLAELSADDGWLVVGWQLPSDEDVRTADREAENPAK